MGRKSLIHYLPLLSSATSAINEGCLNSLEILHLQDGSGSFGFWLNSMTSFTSKLVDRLDAEFGEYKYGVAGWVDKPIPGAGWGPFGGFNRLDYCYHLGAPLSNDVAQISEGFRELWKLGGVGGDWIENPGEALIFGTLDPNVGWSTETHSPSGRPIKKVALLITDDLVHQPDEAQRGIDRYNAPRQYNAEGISRGGFGSHGFADEGDPPFIMNAWIKDSEERTQYLRLADLYSKLDNGIDMTAEEVEEMQQLIDRFGPESWPDVVPHPGDASMPCQETEFPSLEQVSEVLRTNDITPIFLIQKASYANDAAYDWTMDYYLNTTQMLGFKDPILSRFDSTDTANAIDIIIEVLKKTRGECLEITTPAPPVPEITEQPEPEVTEEPEPEVTEKPEPEVTEKPEPEVTEKPEPEVTEKPEPEVTEEPEPEVTERPEPEVTEELIESTDDTEGLVPPPVVPPEGGSDNDSYHEDSDEEGNAGVIAGASAGAAAGLAAVAGALYKFGAGFFHNTPDVDTTGVDQVEVPETAVDREVVGEITLDMFQ